MKRKTIFIVLVCFVVAALAAAVLLLTPAERIVPFVYGTHGIDGIERKNRETKWIIKKYEITGSLGEIREWLTRGHDGAFGQQVFYSFVDWGLAHPEDFVEITEGVELEKRGDLVYLLARGIIDGLDEKEFDEVFDHSDASIIKEVKQQIIVQKRHP